MREHRVPMLSATLRRYPDPTLSADPRVYTLLTDLRTLDIAPAPRAHFRAELRAQLVAVAPRLVADGVAAERPAPEDHGEQVRTAARTPVATRFARLRTLSLGRPVAIVTAVVAVFALLLGGAVWVSKKSLPGDALYSLKRANENVQLSLADGPTAKSKAYLNFAGERVDEVSALLKRSSAVGIGTGHSAGGISAHTASLVESTLSSGDGDVRNASRLLGDAAVDSHSPAQLAIMTGWAPGQLSKLQAIVAKLPAGALQNHASASAQLVSSALVRAQQLSSMINCSCLGSATTDDLGPVPCQPCVAPQGTNLPTLPTTVPLPGRTTTGSTPTGAGTTGSSAAGGSSSADNPGVTGSDSSGGAGSTPPSSKHTLPGITLPTLPPITFPSKTGTKTSTGTCSLSLLGICLKVGS